MSRIGKAPIALPSGVKIDIAGRKVTVTGPKGSLARTVASDVAVALDGPRLVVTRGNDSKQCRADHGTTRALLANMVQGVTVGYSISLELYGTGYSANVQGSNLLLNCGFMGRGVGRPAQYVLPIPDGVQVKVEVPGARGNNEPSKFSINGIDKQTVGQFAAEIRKLRKAEPYLGKGFRYRGEQIRRKAGKVFAGGS